MLFFLDIDGVMVPAKSWKTPEFLNDGFPAFSSNATRALLSLISEEDIVILTTSHKSNYSIEEWKSIFTIRGISIENFKTLPQNLNNISRKEEIVNWFNSNSVIDSFVIIDDDKSLNELPKYLKDNLIQTSSYIGLTEAHVETIKSILNRGLQLV